MFHAHKMTKPRQAINISPYFILYYNSFLFYICIALYFERRLFAKQNLKC